MNYEIAGSHITGFPHYYNINCNGSLFFDFQIVTDM